MQLSVSTLLNVSMQTTLTADELIFHKMMILKRYLADVVDITFQHAEPPEDQICQVSFLYHKLHRVYAKSAHELSGSFAATQMISSIQSQRKA